MNKSMAVLLIFCFFLINLSITFFLYHNHLFLSINGDANSWIELARKVSENKSISQDIWWTPLYPIVISIFFLIPNTLFSISVFQIFLYSIISFFLYKSLSLFINQVKIKLSLTILFTLIPSHLVITKLPLSDTLFLTFFALHVFLFLKFLKGEAKYFIYGVIFLILATFTRPVTFYLHFFEFLFLIFIWRKKIVKNMKPIYFLLIFLIPTLVYTLFSLRNYQNTHVFTFANVSNYNLLAHNYYHLYNYLPENGFPHNVGSELRSAEGEKLRHYLAYQYLDQQIEERFYINSNHISKNERLMYAGKIGTDNILFNLHIYIPIHFLKSTALFMPNMIESLKFLFPQTIILVAMSLSVGIFFLVSFTWSLFKFIRSWKKHKNTTNVAFGFILLNIFYMASIIGPTSLDDGGRSSFAFLFVVIIFFSSNFIPLKK